MSLGSRGFSRAPPAGRSTDAEVEALANRAGLVAAYLVFVVLFSAIVLWSRGHDERFRQRIAAEGCPYAEDADVKRLPGAREQEFRARYCDPIEVASN